MRNVKTRIGMFLFFFVVVAVLMHHLAKIYPAEVTAGLVAMNIALMFNSKV